jgi:hypothetical protein
MQVDGDVDIKNLGNCSAAVETANSSCWIHSIVGQVGALVCGSSAHKHGVQCLQVHEGLTIVISVTNHLSITLSLAMQRQTYHTAAA